MKITRKDVTNYHLIEPIIEKNKKKLERYRNNEPAVAAGKVFGSEQQFPYVARGFTVSGVSPEEYKLWQEWDTKCRYLEITIKQDTDRLIQLKAEIDELIAGIEDVQDKMIFEYIVEGKSQLWISQKLHMDQSTVSLRLKKHLGK